MVVCQIEQQSRDRSDAIKMDNETNSESSNTNKL